MNGQGERPGALGALVTHVEPAEGSKVLLTGLRGYDATSIAASSSRSAASSVGASR